MGPALFELYSSNYSTTRKKAMAQEKVPELEKVKSSKTVKKCVETVKGEQKVSGVPEIVAPKIVPMSRFPTFQVKFIGSSILDRRYTLPMLPWIVADIKRQASLERRTKEVLLEISDIALKATAVDNGTVMFVHSLQNISKFEQTAQDKNYFTYLTRDHPDSFFTCHVFQAFDENIILDLFTRVREATKEIVQQSGSQLMRVGSCTGLDNILTNSQQYEVMYIGKVKMSHKRDPTFIDDAVESFRSGEHKGCTPIIKTTTERTYSDPTFISNTPHLPRSMSSLTTCTEFKEPEDHIAEQVTSRSIDVPTRESIVKDLRTYSQSETRESLSPIHSPSRSPVSSNVLHLPPASLIPNTQSLDESGRASIMKDLQKCTVNKADVKECSDSSSLRLRSVSGDIPRTTPPKQSSLPQYRSRTGSGGSDMKRNRGSNKLENKTMLFLIGRLELCLISPDRHKVQFNKTFNYVSHCSQGKAYSDHFGFICKETAFNSSEAYVGYVFKCQSEKLVEEIMKALKQAFQNAHQSYQTNKNKATVICDTCPMHWYHIVCCDVESRTPEEAQNCIFKRIDSLPEQDQNDILGKYRGINANSTQAQNENLMTLLREMSEKKQKKHSHHQKEHPYLEKRSSTLDTFKQKAKKSLSNSFETILKPLMTSPKDECGRLRSASIDTSDRSFTHYVCRKLAHGDSSDLGTTPESLSPSSSTSKNEFSFEDFGTRPRSSTISGDKNLQRESSPGMGFRSESIPLHQPKSPLFNIFSKIGSKSSPATVPEESSNSASPVGSFSPNFSWRKSMLTNIQSQDRDSKKNVTFCEKKKRTKEELRDLWKKAINEQIVLIRMEKENRKLQASQSIASNKRMKLDYLDMEFSVEDAVNIWDAILQKKDIQKSELEAAVHKGIPKHKRGEVWLFLAKQQKEISDFVSDPSIDLDTPYRKLLQNLTEQQHAILVDLGRTFPKHPYYAQPLGAGQLSLFNLLKAYSLFDKEVGYCQGLSFVAGILLLHMSEDDAFEMMKHLLFFQGLRKQYTPDMSALQMQLYKLTRLLYDFHRDLYDHFEQYDISPTLYAAPWWLTLFASQFSIGFVARLFDLIFMYGLQAVFRVSLTLLASFKHSLMQCHSFESIMDFIKNDIPSMDTSRMETIFDSVFALEIGKQLSVYEIEYNIMLEELPFVNGSQPSSQTKNVSFVSNVSKEVSTETYSEVIERLKELEAENKNLRREVMEITDQLHVSQSTVHSLESSLDNYKSTIKRLETRARSSEDERELLLQSLNILRLRLEKLESSGSEVHLTEGEKSAPILNIVTVPEEGNAESSVLDEEKEEDYEDKDEINDEHRIEVRKNKEQQ